jgi:hypothetical protein
VSTTAKHGLADCPLVTVGYPDMLLTQPAGMARTGLSHERLSHFQDSPQSPVPATITDAWAQLVLPLDGAGGTRTPPEARQRLGLVAHRPNPPQAHARCDHEMWGRTT